MNTEDGRPGLGPSAANELAGATGGSAEISDGDHPQSLARASNRRVFAFGELAVPVFSLVALISALVLVIREWVGHPLADVAARSWGGLWGGLGLAGLSVSLFGVWVALRIYSRQTESQELFAGWLQTVLAALRRRTDQTAAKADEIAQRIERQEQALFRYEFVIGNAVERRLWEYAIREPLDDLEKSAQRRYDPYPLQSPNEGVESGIVTIAGQEGRVFSADEVPLRVIGDLLNHWEHEGERGYWPVGYLLGAFRPTGDGRNYPWIVTFEKPDGERRIWRVFRGGRGRSTPVVREIRPES